VILWTAYKEMTRSVLVFSKSWKIFLPCSILSTAGLFFFLDYIISVGASKVGLLSGPLETIVIIVIGEYC